MRRYNVGGWTNPYAAFGSSDSWHTDGGAAGSYIQADLGDTSFVACVPSAPQTAHGEPRMHTPFPVPPPRPQVRVWVAKDGPRDDGAAVGADGGL